MVTKTFPETTLYPNGPKWATCLPPDLLARPGLQLMVREALSIGSIGFRLPKSLAVAGAVLRHCIFIIENLFLKHYPLIFKIGFTHDCVWRWSNSIYGYGHARDRWSNMIILHICAEPFTAAMLEAALIERFEGNLAIFGLLSCTVNLGRIAFHECMGTMHIHVHTLMLEVCYHGSIFFPCSCLVAWSTY